MQSKRKFAIDFTYSQAKTLSDTETVYLLVHHLTFYFLSVFYLRENPLSVGDSFGDGLFTSRNKKTTLVNI